MQFTCHVTLLTVVSWNEGAYQRPGRAARLSSCNQAWRICCEKFLQKAMVQILSGRHGIVATKRLDQCGKKPYSNHPHSTCTSLLLPARPKTGSFFHLHKTGNLGRPQMCCTLQTVFGGDRRIHFWISGPVDLHEALHLSSFLPTGYATTTAQYQSG